jgi:CDP-L-myo-inositol myo-inositolphosphotransferase
MRLLSSKNDNGQCSAPIAVILAAGNGYRLQNGSDTIPKPLINVRGLSLAERSVAQLQSAGINRFVVVLGAHADPVRAHFECIAKRRCCAIDSIVAKDWERGNGCSAAAVESLVGDEQFLLTMVDHLLSRELILKLVSEPPPPEGIALAVDYDKNHIFDEADLTKVRIENDHIAEIGKDLEKWDAGDTGLFYCTGELFRGLSRARVHGGFSLTDGIRECFNGGVQAIDVTGNDWIDVDTPEAVREAVALVDASLTKGREDGFVSQYLNRPISRAVSKVFSRTSVSPNQISVVCFLLGLLGAGALALTSAWAWMIGGLLIQLASILDGCDGEIARIKHLQSSRGAWLDTMLDRYADLAVGIAVTFAASRLYSAPWIWPTGLVAIMSFLLASYVTKEYELRFGKPYPNNYLNRLKRRDLRVLVITVGALLGQPFSALIAIGALTHLVVLWIMIDAWRRAGQPVIPKALDTLIMTRKGAARLEKTELVGAASRSSE